DLLHTHVATIVLVVTSFVSSSSLMNCESSTLSVINVFSGSFSTFLIYRITNRIPITVITASMIPRYPIPENKGSSAMVWAVPRLAGAVSASEKPTTVAISTVPVAAMRSKPSLRNSGSNAGRKISEDSMLPVNETNIARGMTIAGMISNLLFPNCLIKKLMMTSMTPAFSMTLNIAPIAMMPKMMMIVPSTPRGIAVMNSKIPTGDWATNSNVPGMITDVPL